MNPTKRITADTLRQLPPAKVKQLFTQLGPAKVDELQHDWSFWGRDAQFPPTDNEWNTWLINAGRGFGKTRCGAEWVRQQVKDGHKRIAL
jgi:phage terminase large subunit-like protein